MILEGLAVACLLTLGAQGEKQRIFLKVVDHEGRPVSLVPEDPRSLSLPRLFCVPSDDRGRALHRFLSIPVRKFAGQGRGVAEVDPGRMYLVGFVAADVPPQLRQVYVPHGGYPFEETFPLPPPVEPGELHVTVRRPMGGLGWLGSSRPNFQVFDADSGLLMASSNCPPYRKWGASFELPPGKYVLRGEEQKWVMCGHGLTEPLVPDVSPSEALVEVHSGSRTDFELELRGSGRIRLIVEGTEGERTLSWEEIWEIAQRAFVHESPTLETRQEVRDRIWAPVRNLLRGIEVRARSVDTRETLLLRWNPADSHHWVDPPWAVPGEPCNSITPIPPGRWELIATLIDGRELRTEVDVEHGRVTEVTLRAD